VDAWAVATMADTVTTTSRDMLANLKNEEKKKRKKMKNEKKKSRFLNLFVRHCCASTRLSSGQRHRQNHLQPEDRSRTFNAKPTHASPQATSK
jgi:hypothetical protein